MFAARQTPEIRRDGDDRKCQEKFTVEHKLFGKVLSFGYAACQALLTDFVRRFLFFVMYRDPAAIVW
jgi:hypothetical protein